MTPILAPIVAELTATRQQLVSQAETIGRQGAELERAASTIVTLNAALEARTAAQNENALSALSPPRWRLWASWGSGALTVLTIIALVVVMAWPR